jgi:hypothetical protein
MDPDAGSTSWDFLELVARWNLYGLPGLLSAVAIIVVVSLVRDRPAHPQVSFEGGPPRAGRVPQLLFVRPRLRTLRLIALIHVGLALRWGIGLIQELLTLRVQGIPQSFPVTGIVIPAVSIVANLAIGHGLWWFRPWSHKLAIRWDMVTAVVATLVAAWQWRYHAAVSLEQWPDYLVADGLPWFLLIVMLMPGTKSALKGPRGLPLSEDFPPETRRASWLSALLSLATALLLTVVTSTIAVDAVDWAVRSFASSPE